MYIPGGSLLYSLVAHTMYAYRCTLFFAPRVFLSLTQFVYRYMCIEAALVFCVLCVCG